jgi:hypothetical protein
MAIRASLLLILLLAAVGLPQEPSVTKALAQVKADSLVDDSWYGLYLRGKNVGSMSLVAVLTSGSAGGLERPPTYFVVDGDLTVTLRTEFALDGESGSVQEHVRMNLKEPAFSAAQLNRSADGEQRIQLRYMPKGSETIDVRIDQRSWSSPRGDSFGHAMRITFARALSRSGTSRYTLDEVVPDEEKVRPVDVIIDDTPDGRRVRFVPQDDADDVWEMIVAPDGTLTSMRHLLQPGLIYLRAKDEAEAKVDRPGAGLPPAASPRGVVLQYLRAFVRADAAKLEPTIDWPALHEALGAQDIGQDVDAFRRSFLDGLAAAQEELGLTSDDVEDLGLGLEEQVTPDGLRAVVTIPGEPDRVRLGRETRDAPWRIRDLAE